MSFSLQSSLRRVTQTFVRSFQNKAAVRPLPPPQGDITTPKAFLSAIGRSTETKVSIDGWEAFWHTSGHDLKKAGVAVKDRRYVLWCMEKYRQRMPIEDFAHEARPKKTIRGETDTVASTAVTG
ncbi:hypothetical protein JVT61DRAFT_1165 [Boletus reticuloceps]|uniref:Small ribosomal subunit protein mS41 n=1 Tax=Boletus reticuloceps TaxID=495285 RepID=A0A8I2YS07_9AGAM|nr:hypothetical protein JVT61DRAFT_1165 [Boletus reticuloceps]